MYARQEQQNVHHSEVSSYDWANSLQRRLVLDTAKQYGYILSKHNPQSRVVFFLNSSENVRVNLYYTTGAIATVLYHPSQGKTQLFRRSATKKLDITLLKTVFANP